MKQAKSKQIATPRRRCWASLLIGLCLAAIAGTAAYIDLRNNHKFGASISEELGLVMALAAIALMVLPAAAALLGRWDAILRTGTIFAVLLTIVSAVAAYGDKQGAQILARQANEAAYEAAQRDAEAARQEIESARTEAALITEHAAVADLEKLEAFHRKQIVLETEKRGGCGTACRGHETAIETILARLPLARAKEMALERVVSAQGRLEAAKVEAQAGPAEASMLATIIAGRIGYEPGTVARVIALTMTGFAITVTLAMALLMHQATALMMKGLGVIEIGRQNGRDDATALLSENPVWDRPEIIPASATLETALTPNSVEARIHRFAKECFVQGGETTGGDVQEAFAEWWRQHFAGELQPSPVILSRELLAAGLTKEKKSGRVRYNAKLRIPMNA
jgi:hypothetical protein